MLIVMAANATDAQIAHVCEQIEKMGFEARPMPGEVRTAIGIVGNDGPIDRGRFVGLPGVKDAISVSAPYKLVSREWKASDTVVRLGNGTEIGGGSVAIMAGPCSVESRDQIRRSAELVREHGGTVLRGGAFKPRTSPYSFQGLGEQGLVWMREAADEFGLATVTEAIDSDSARLVEQYADMIQLGARNMQNFALLNTVGAMRKPVLLKRGMAATMKEWLLAAEYLLAAGNEDVILCERGIRSFDPATRNVMDIGAIALAKSLSHLPVIGDPSHGTGVRSLVPALARATVASGADGLIVEMHPNPDEALSDGAQTLFPEQFSAMVAQVRGVVEGLGNRLAAL